MSYPQSSSYAHLWFAICISVFGIVSLPLLLLQGKPQVDFPFGRILVGSTFAAICTLGIIAVFYPKKCQNNFLSTHSELAKYGDATVLFGKTSFTGHHPACEKFSANRIQIRKTIFCASCAGLLVGAVIALVGTLLYFFLNATFFSTDLEYLVISSAGMLLGLVQLKFKGYAKLAANTLFVLFSFTTLVTVDFLGKNLLIDFYALAIIVAVLLTRITFSQWNNRRTCSKCRSCSLHL